MLKEKIRITKDHVSLNAVHMVIKVKIYIYIQNSVTFPNTSNNLENTVEKIFYSQQQQFYF